MYQSKGLSEIVRYPSTITYKYLEFWFTGSGPFGKSLTKLGWPTKKSDRPLLVLKDDKLVVDLKAEEDIMYSRTVIHYVKKKEDYKLQIDPRKLISPMCIFGTIKAIYSQSKLLVDYQKTYNLVKNQVDSIPLIVPQEKTEIEYDLEDKVWPQVIMADYIAEFIYSVLANKLKNNHQIETIARLQDRISSDDWYTQAILAWSDIKEKRKDVDGFLKNYGYASNNEYELTEPRYYELLKKGKPRVDKVEIKEMKVKSLEDLYVGLQYLRSQAKRKSLIWIAALREKIIKK